VISGFQLVAGGSLAFFVVYSLATLTLLVLSFRQIAWYARGQQPTGALLAAPKFAHRPSVSLVVPAYNEQTLIVQSVGTFLALDYPKLEVVVVDDGSTDDTLAVLGEAFDLIPLPLRGRTALPTAAIHNVFISRRRPQLHVVQKENGGRSDAINAGISVARGELIAVTDADSMMEPDAIARAVRPFEANPDTCVAVGGAIRIANGSTIVDGRVSLARVPARGVAATQILEYLRGFLGSRIAWSKLNGLLIISGAFGVFRRDLLVGLGGFSSRTLGEDMELTMRLHRRVRPSWPHAHIEYAPDAVCWTEGPADMRSLRTQRVRWHVGLLDNLLLHWKMCGRPRFGAAGTIAYPYALLFEAIAPILEFVGYIVVVTLLILRPTNWPYFAAFIVVTVLLGQVLNATALLIAEVGFRRYTTSDMARLMGWGLLESFWYRPANAWWRAWATFLTLIGRRPGWGTIPRGQGIELPHETAITPLTR
jgi:cellulose synthase/poly-beta-1,6-N-acetylglucosamine synthase-like glycosyltransferase